MMTATALASYNTLTSSVSYQSIYSRTTKWSLLLKHIDLNIFNTEFAFGSDQHIMKGFVYTFITKNVIFIKRVLAA